MISQVDDAVRLSLTTFAQEMVSGEWSGKREREVVSLFCFGHLIRQCRTGTFLEDPTQIAIEVAVPQIAGQGGLTGKSNSKNQVCKDIVIWPQPRMTCWDGFGKPTIPPAGIIEWKHNEGKVSSYDVRWLCEFSARFPDFVGYAVCSNQPARDFGLSCTRVFRGQAEGKWLHLG